MCLCYLLYLGHRIGSFIRSIAYAYEIDSFLDCLFVVKNYILVDISVKNDFQHNPKIWSLPAGLYESYVLLYDITVQKARLGSIGTKNWQSYSSVLHTNDVLFYSIAKILLDLFRTVQQSTQAFLQAKFPGFSFCETVITLYLFTNMMLWINRISQ